MKRLRGSFLLFLTVCLSFQMVYAYEYSEVLLTASDLSTFDDFGSSVAIEGNTAIVGAPHKQGIIDDGAVYLYTRSSTGWSNPSRLRPLDPGWGSRHFGNAVAIDSNYIIVGAEWATGGGAAYIFHFDGIEWYQQAKLVGTASDDWENFGCTVDIQGDYAIVGAYFETFGSLTNAGSAYIFKRTGSTWNLDGKLYAIDSQADQWFGYTVGIYGTTAVVGAHPVSSATAGWAYIYQKSDSDWVLRRKLAESESSDAVVIYNRTIVVGDEWDWNVGVYAYEDFSPAGDWSTFSTIKVGGSETIPGDHFGNSLAIDGNTIVVGADGKNFSTGAVYIYRRGLHYWELQKKLESIFCSTGDYFGCSVDISGGRIIVGAESADSPYGNITGAASVFEQPTSVDFNWMVYE